MNIVLLIAVMLTLSLAHGYNPCRHRARNNAYSTFVQRHIIKESFNRSSRVAWQNYITESGLTNRTRQSFIEGRDEDRVVNICNGGGYPISQRGNLCISTFRLLVYDLTVNNNGIVGRPMNKRKKVIVACDKVGNQCRPVHFERYDRQEPYRGAGHCRP